MVKAENAGRVSTGHAELKSSAAECGLRVSRRQDFSLFKTKAKIWMRHQANITIQVFHVGVHVKTGSANIVHYPSPPILDLG